MNTPVSSPALRNWLKATISEVDGFENVSTNAQLRKAFAASKRLQNVDMSSVPQYIDKDVYVVMKMRKQNSNQVYDQIFRQETCIDIANQGLCDDAPQCQSICEKREAFDFSIPIESEALTTFLRNKLGFEQAFVLFFLVTKDVEEEHYQECLEKNASRWWRAGGQRGLYKEDAIQCMTIPFKNDAVNCIKDRDTQYVLLEDAKQCLSKAFCEEAEDTEEKCREIMLANTTQIDPRFFTMGYAKLAKIMAAFPEQLNDLSKQLKIFFHPEDTSISQPLNRLIYEYDRDYDIYDVKCKGQKNITPRSIKNIGSPGLCPNFHILKGDCCEYKPSRKLRNVFKIYEISKYIQTWKREEIVKIADTFDKTSMATMQRILKDIDDLNIKQKNTSDPTERAAIELKLNALEQEKKTVSNVDKKKMIEDFESAQREYDAWRASRVGKGGAEEVFADLVYHIIFNAEIKVKEKLFAAAVDKNREISSVFSLEGFIKYGRILKDYSLDLLIYLVKHPQFALAFTTVVKEIRDYACRQASIKLGNIKMISKEEHKKTEPERMQENAEAVSTMTLDIVQIMMGPDIDSTLKMAMGPLELAAGAMFPFASAVVSGVMNVLLKISVQSIRAWFWKRIYSRGLENIIDIFDIKKCMEPIPIRNFNIPQAWLSTGLFQPNAATPAFTQLTSKVEHGSYEDFIKFMDANNKTLDDAKTVLDDEQLIVLQHRLRKDYPKVLQRMIARPDSNEEDDEGEEDDEW